MITRREVEDEAALHGRTYAHRTFAQLRTSKPGYGLVEILGTKTQQRSTYGRGWYDRGQVTERGAKFLMGRRWLKNAGRWSRPFKFHEEAIEHMVDGWKVANLESRARLKRKARRR